MINSEIEITALVPDQIIRAELNSDGAKLIVVDTLRSGGKREVQCTSEELSLVMYLLINGDEGALSQDAYPRVEHLFTDWPKEFRPIP